ncbi:hypothetical protein AiwAL_15370 [Acidiphilium sp. AL]|nr:hypothetical protein [Acidiphilium sp. AL]
MNETDASLLDDPRSLVEPETRGDPQSPLLRTCKSLRKLSQSLCGMGHTIGRTRLSRSRMGRLAFFLRASGSRPSCNVRAYRTASAETRASASRCPDGLSLPGCARAPQRRSSNVWHRPQYRAPAAIAQARTRHAPQRKSPARSSIG